MTIEHMRAAYDAKPFLPFIMHLADGSAIPVQSREFIMAVPKGRTLVVCQPDGALNIIDLLLVTHLETKPATNGVSRRRRA